MPLFGILAESCQTFFYLRNEKRLHFRKAILAFGFFLAHQARMLTAAHPRHDSTHTHTSFSLAIFGSKTNSAPLPLNGIAVTTNTRHRSPQQQQQQQQQQRRKLLQARRATRRLCVRGCAVDREMATQWGRRPQSMVHSRHITGVCPHPPTSQSRH